ncbi:glycoside hydrolase family 36 protein [Paenibacillus sp. FJAT-26967]|uniref:glycoside hydrolase family 36 protein n=1 Tax=Paenibacillus sp. FJAT-26967 TaxID=1729690 RepID=UPI000A075DCC|nr:glycoside hydrolase family 36 protein [Paenibacillus sp. FJAT-26967]
MTYATGTYAMNVKGGEGFRISLTSLSSEGGIELVRLRMESDTPLAPRDIQIRWNHPAVDIQGYWDPGANRDKGLRIDFSPAFDSKATSLAPVYSLYNLNGLNRLTVAYSDALRPHKMRAGIHEETAEFECLLQLFTEPSPPMTEYEAVIRLDTRELFYADCLREVGEWWAAMPGYEPSPVPAAARMPMYSTWYSFHQELVPGQVEEQCRLAKQLGCEAVIVDDGWQTTSNERGYAYCGDWQVSPERIPDMKAHVFKVHEAGLKYILWYSVPFVGPYSGAYKKFENKFIDTYGTDGTAVVDPRFPEVREYLIGTYEQALRDWDLDGFKLDFVDSFNLSEEMKDSLGGGRDYDSVPEAVDRLLTDTMTRLRSIKPDIIIEFRQKYIGPLMRKYGNMFRVADCPNNSSQNRIGSIDIRLLSGDTAVHSDMLMWNPDEPVESAALQLINSLFSVPQISMLLDRLPEDHQQMVSFWLRFWMTNRDVLLGGKLTPLSPDMLYPVVTAAAEHKSITAVYAEHIVKVGELPRDSFIFVNGTLQNRIVADFTVDSGERNMTVLDCKGNVAAYQLVSFTQGLHSLPVPPGGLIILL